MVPADASAASLPLPATVARPRTIVAMVLAVIWLAAVTQACTGGAPTRSVTGLIEPGTPEAPRVVNVIMRDYLFEPDPIVLVPGETVRFNIVNAGLLPHEFVLGDAAVQAAWASAEAAATPPGFTATPPPVSLAPEVGGLRIFLESGGIATADYVVPAGVQLELACRIPGHVEQGMVGTVALTPEP